MLDLRRLRTLREVVDRRSFSAAARALDYTQSSVSEQVATLERELGVSLIERSGRPLRPTAAGEIVLAHAAELLGRAAWAERELAMLARGEAGPLGLCGFFTAWATFMPAAVAAFSGAHPAVKLDLHQHEPAPALSGVRARDLDVAVVYRFAAEGDGDLTWTRLLDDPYAVVLPAGDPLAEHENLSLAELEQRRWVCPPADHDYTKVLRGLCREHGGFEPDVGYETGDIAMVQPLVAAGLAVGVMPLLALWPRHEGVAVRPLRKTPLARSVWAVRPAQRPAPAAGAMVDALVAAAGTSAAPRLG
ncbi:MAG TPA: LysR family transcriptional regulator [Solirubrobacteraceae bacterium]|nr:LysR family transcriptional regulator [Solirubrobacteraceae bacterium]